MAPRCSNPTWSAKDERKGGKEQIVVNLRQKKLMMAVLWRREGRQPVLELGAYRMQAAYEMLFLAAFFGVGIMRSLPPLPYSVFVTAGDIDLATRGRRVPYYVARPRDTHGGLCVAFFIYLMSTQENV